VRLAGGGEHRLPIRNVVNPRIGSRVQQTCSTQVEKAVEVVENGKDGTCGERGSSSPRKSDSLARTRTGVDTWNVERWRDGL
jgi:hypothetical protein